MADNTATSTGDTIRTDELNTLNGVDVSGASPRIKAESTKVGFGSDGVMREVDTSNPLPVISNTRVLVGVASHNLTLVAATVLTVNITAHAAEVEISLPDGVAFTAPVFIRTDGTDPVVNGTGAEVFGVGDKSLTINTATAGNTVVKLISSAGKVGGISVVGRA